MSRVKTNAAPTLNSTTFTRWKRCLLFALALFLVALAMYVFKLVPTHSGAWSPLQARLPQVIFSADTDTYHVSGLRDFRYNADGSVRKKHYRDDDYAVRDLQRVWLGISHFGGFGLAHTFLSFQFTDNRFLAVSIEARLRPGQHYSPIAGLLRQYNKIVVLGSEADIIGLRAKVRAERVLLYPMQLDAQQLHYVFRAVMEDAQAIAAQPGFYNTLFDNCATNLLKYDPGYRFYQSILDYRLLLPGFSDRVAQERGWISNTESLTVLRQKAQVNSAGMILDDADFSLKIRRGWQSEQTQSVSPAKLP